MFRNACTCVATRWTEKKASGSGAVLFIVRLDGREPLQYKDGWKCQPCGVVQADVTKWSMPAVPEEVAVHPEKRRPVAG